MLTTQLPKKLQPAKGTPTEPGKTRPTANRTVDENPQLFERMRKGSLKKAKTLRAKIDMASPNMHLRDPR